jgi:hypothetical protein
MPAPVHSLNTGEHDVTEYLMVSALILLVVCLSLPTIMQLATLLRADITVSRRPQPVNGVDTSFTRLASSARLTPVRVQAGSADRAVV